MLKFSFIWNFHDKKVPEPISSDINDPVLKSILKYKDHPSIKATEKISKLNNLFKFSNVEKKEVLNEIVNLDASKSCQDTDVPTKIIKDWHFKIRLSNKYNRNIKLSTSNKQFSYYWIKFFIINHIYNHVIKHY